MAQNASADGRTDTERFSEDVSAENLIEGDRISPKLVARHPDQVGEPIRRTTPEQDDEPDTKLVVVTQMNHYDDVHSAILLDPEAETFVRASRHDSQQAWSQAEADWTVREIGAEVVVEDVHELERPENEQDQPADEYVQEWVEILFDELRFTGGDIDMGNERDLDGTTLKLRDVDGRKTMASIGLEG